MPANNLPHPERFWSQVDDTGDCWIWTGYLTPSGYGYYTHNGRSRPAHVWAYELLIGPVPDGLELAHACHNPACVRPGEGHARPLTHRANMLEGLTNPAARAAKATHCPHGHPYDRDNTVIMKSGARRCRICRNAAEADRRRRRKKGKDDGARNDHSVPADPYPRPRR